VVLKFELRTLTCHLSHTSSLGITIKKKNLFFRKITNLLFLFALNFQNLEKDRGS
jgi:hypothetical protein